MNHGVEGGHTPLEPGLVQVQSLKFETAAGLSVRHRRSCTVVVAPRSTMCQAVWLLGQVVSGMVDVLQLKTFYVSSQAGVS